MIEKYDMDSSEYGEHDLFGQLVYQIKEDDCPDCKALFYVTFTQCQKHGIKAKVRESNDQS